MPTPLLCDLRPHAGGLHGPAASQLTIDVRAIAKPGAEALGGVLIVFEDRRRARWLHARGLDYDLTSLLERTSVLGMGLRDLRPHEYDLRGVVDPDQHDEIEAAAP